jgi:hypothetical protein
MAESRALMSESRRQLSKFTVIFAGGTMISRVSGLFRDIVTAAVIPREAWAAFNVAFRFPSMLRDLVGEGASNAAFIPVLSGILEKESKPAFREAVSALMSAMIVLLGGITILGGGPYRPTKIRFVEKERHHQGHDYCDQKGVKPRLVDNEVSQVKGLPRDSALNPAVFTPK